MAANDRLRVLLFLGSTRAGRVGGRVGQWVAASLAARGHTVDVVDPLELAKHDEHAPSDQRMFPMRRPFFFYPKDKAPPVLEKLAATVQDADAYVMVTPEFNHAPAPALLDTLNHFGGSSYAFKPSAIVSYSAGQWCGCSATARHTSCVLIIAVAARWCARKDAISKSAQKAINCPAICRAGVVRGQRWHSGQCCPSSAACPSRQIIAAGAAALPFSLESPGALLPPWHGDAPPRCARAKNARHCRSESE